MWAFCGFFISKWNVTENRLLMHLPLPVHTQKCVLKWSNFLPVCLWVNNAYSTLRGPHLSSGVKWICPTSFKSKTDFLYIIEWPWWLPSATL